MRTYNNLSSKLYRIGEDCFIPVLASVVVKSIDDVDLAKETCTGTFTFILKLLLGDIGDEFKKNILEEGFQIRINDIQTTIKKELGEKSYIE